MGKYRSAECDRQPAGTQASAPAFPAFSGRLSELQFGFAIRTLGLVLLAVGVGSSSITFNLVIEHNPELNFFPEFAGRVVYLSDGFLLAGLLVWVTGRWLAPCGPLKYGPKYVFYPLLLIVALTTLSVVWADDGTQAGFAAVRRILLLGLYLVMVNEARRAFVPFVVVLFGIGLLQAGVGMAQVAEGSALGLTRIGEIPEGSHAYGLIGSNRAFGLGFNPNPLGLFLAVVGALAYALIWMGWGGWRTRAVTFFVFAVMLVGVGATGSRSALLGSVLAIGLVSVVGWIAGFRRGNLRRIGTGPIWLLIIVAGILTFAIVVAAVGGPVPSQRALSVIGSVAERFSSGTIVSGVSERAKDWAWSLPVIRDNLALGVGAANYPLELKKRINPNTFGGGRTPPHNVPLLITAELGVAGGVAWALILASPLVWGLSRRGRRQPGFYSIVWLGPLVVLFFEGFWDFTPWATQDGRLLMMGVLGLWAGGVSEEQAAERDSDGSRAYSSTAPEG